METNAPQNGRTRQGAAELLRLLRGQGCYLDDVETPKNTLHLAFVRSPYARAGIRGVDTEAASKLPGVARIVTGADLEHAVRPLSARLEVRDDYVYHAADWPALAVGEARYVGEAVAVVAADSRYVAEDAAALVEVDYEPLPAVADTESALAPDAPRVHAHLPDNVLYRQHAGKPSDAPEFDAPGLVRVHGRFRHPRVAGLSMEARGVLADYHVSTDELVLWSSTQIPHLLRDALSESLGLPASNLRVIAPDVGGAFGIKMQAFPEELTAAFLAYVLKRPVKWVEDRLENLQATCHARDAVVDAELAAHPDGRIAWIRASGVFDVGAYSTFPLTCALEPATAAPALPGPYKVPFFAYDGIAVATNKCPEGAYRGVGVPVGPIVTEGLLNALAARLGRDPAEIRRINLVAADEFPYKSASGATFDSGDYPGLLRLAMGRAGYDGWRRLQKVERAQGKLVGVGVCCFIEPTGMNRATYRARGMIQVPGFDGAILRVDPAGRIEAAVSIPSQGQTQATAFTQLLVESLGVAAETIHVTLGDTARTPYGCGTFASRGMVAGGGALLKAARQLKEKVCRLAAQHWAVGADLVGYQNGGVTRSDTGARLSFQELAEIAHSPLQRFDDGAEPGLEIHTFYDPPVTTIASGVHLALVEVDRGTGKVTIRKYVVGEDCGPMVNRQAVEGQVRGGVAQGIGTALLEEVRYDPDGQLLTATLADYLIPGPCDVPEIDVVHQETPSPYTEGGLKGVGESGVIGAPAAVYGAVLDAIGVHPERIELPLTPERVKQWIDSRDSS